MALDIEQGEKGGYRWSKQIVMTPAYQLSDSEQESEKPKPSAKDDGSTENRGPVSKLGERGNRNLNRAL